jgi:uncharacterized membrane protein
MGEPKATADRVGAFSDGVIAVIITIMVLGLKAPEEASFSALVPLWPTAISYAVSYLFRRHHLAESPPSAAACVRHTTLALIRVNFAPLFAVALIPFSTAWVASTRFAAAPVAFMPAFLSAPTSPTSCSSGRC